MTRTTTPTTQKNALAGVSVGKGQKKAARVISPLLQRALDAGRRICDDMQDGPDARQQMKREILEIARTDERLLVGLIAAFQSLRIKRSDFSTTSKQPQE